MNSTVYTPSEVTEDDLKEISVHSFDPTLSNHQKAYYHYLRGKLFNIFENYNLSAEANLCKAVKLDPRLTDAWKQLGECFWKKGDLDAAENCFQWTVDIEGSPSSLVLLSMVQRRKNKGIIMMFAFILEYLTLCPISPLQKRSENTRG